MGDKLLGVRVRYMFVHCSVVKGLTKVSSTHIVRGMNKKYARRLRCDPLTDRPLAHYNQYNKAKAGTDVPKQTNLLAVYEYSIGHLLLLRENVGEIKFFCVHRWSGLLWSTVIVKKRVLRTERLRFVLVGENAKFGSRSTSS